MDKTATDNYSANLDLQSARYGGHTDRRAGGSGGCNSYGAEYQMQDGKLSFSKIISTKRVCVAEGLMQQEQRYFRALESAGKYELADDCLTISYDDGQSSLNFVKTRPSTSAE